MRHFNYKKLIFVLFGSLLLSYFFPVHLLAQTQKKLSNSKDYINIIKHFRYLDPDSATHYVQLGLTVAEKQGDQLGKAALLNQYGMIDDNFARYRESRQKYLEAEAIYRQQHDQVGLAMVLIRLAVVERRKGNYDKSFAYAMKALKVSENNKHKLGIMEARVVLAETYYDLNDYPNALQNLRLARELEKQLPLNNLTLNMYDDFGAVYNKMKDFDTAIQYVKIGLSKSNRIEYNGLRISLMKTLGRAYQLKGDVKRAEKTFKDALAFSRQIKNILREHAILTELASIYDKKQPDTALKYLNQALAIVSKYKMYRQQITILDKIAAIHKQTGNLAEALKAKEVSSSLAEQVFYKDMMKQVFSLESAYELEKSKAQLNELATKNKEQKILKNVILSVAITIFVVLVFTLINYLRSRHLNQLLTKANRELEESNEVKDKFFSIIAHDIRSPLVSTISILKLIGDNELDENTQKLMVAKLLSHCNSSLEILDKLLKWGQMQIKGVRLHVQEFSPASSIKRNLGLLREAADKKQIEINVSVSDDLVLKADTDHFDFIVRNLLANAIKFTETHGKISLSAQAIDKDTVQFALSDTGVGISDVRLDKLFELSAMGTKGTSSEEGTSLGLVICKEFVLANEGKLKVESRVGQGTTFYFTMKGYLKKTT
ncbi:ATP-binding protein [Nubsella zeaxanthinifaciens]|jgi:signal transduction histidine kinase|uniref:ATP-binding protein n=1 Tax=Nubsella zeaxanthinifaciens TaxID=392412 RepID=UPI000DE53287|nr:tetratricopeptide repeat-containing sensor histidine kinase [Nubsella zeaxanthinifaciens]